MLDTLTGKKNLLGAKHVIENYIMVEEASVTR
jgi:hypothetical protein